MSGRFAGKVAVVTGGARGMGEATVRLFTQEGAKVMIADVLEAEGKALAAALGDAAEFVRLDVSNEADWAALVEGVILTDADGIVIDVGALPAGSDAADRHARDIARVGIDLSERAVGTTAIGAVLAEQAPVWLHRAEHFFDDTGIYSCAGAPLFGPQGDCIGMLDLTGVQVVERPELRHLAALSARSIENALVRAQPHALMLRFNWPGCASGDDADGLLGLDADGRVVASNGTARQMLQQPLARGTAAQSCHASDLFALPVDMLWDAARRGDAVDVPLWSGLRLQAWARLADADVSAASSMARPRLRDVETALIRKAVDEARGNVAEAARTLGISRATVYRKLAARGR